MSLFSKTTQSKREKKSVHPVEVFASLTFYQDLLEVPTEV